MGLSEVADLYIILRAVTAPFTEAMGRAGAEGEAAGNRINSGIGRVSPVIMGIAAATGLAAVASMKWATDFETQYTRLYTAAGASKDQVLAARDAMLQLGTQTGYTGAQIAEALYHPVSAGLDLATSLKVVSASAQEARISGANLDDTTFALSSIMKAFNINATGAQGTMSVLNAIVGDGDMHFQDFNTSIKNWAPTAAAMGISIKSMGAGLAYLTDRGNSADEAATRMTMGIAMMATPSAQAAKLLEGMGVASGDVKASSQAMTEALQKAHITQNQLATDLQQPDGLYVALHHLQTALKDAGVSGTEADSILSKIFGGGRSDKAILSLMGNLDQLKQKYDQISKDSTAAQFQKDWENAQKTTAVQFDKLKAEVINLGTQLGLVLLPPLKTVLGYITNGIEWITKHKEAMIALAGVITGIVIVALVKLGETLLVTAAQAMANPIVDIIAAIALGAIEIVTHWKQVKQFFEELWAWIDSHKTMLLMILGPMFPMLAAFVTAAYLVITHWKEIWAFLKKLGSDLLQWSKDVGGFFVRMWDDVSKGAKEGWDKAVSVAKSAWKEIKRGWNDTVGELEKIWKTDGVKVVHEISKDWDEATAAISKEWHHITDDLTSIWGSLVSIWNSTGGKLVHWISDAMDWIGGVIHGNWSEIKQYFTGVWQAIWGVIKSYLDIIKAALKVAWDVIRGVAKSAWDLIWGIIKTAWDIIWNGIKVVVDMISGFLKAAWETMKGTVKTVWDLITGILNTALDYIRDLLKLFADFFSGHWSKLWGDVKKLAFDAWNNIKSTVGKVFGDIITTVVKSGGDLIHGFWKALEDGIATVKSAFNDIYKTVIAFFKDVGHWLYQAGKDLIQGLINGISDMATGAADAVSNIASSVWKSAKHGFGLWSPSHIAYEHGQMIVQGLINGLNSMSNAAADSMTGVAKDVMGSLSTGTSGMTVGGSLPVTAQGAYAPGVINIYVEGTVLSDRDLRDLVQEQMLQLGARYSTSYTPYKR